MQDAWVSFLSECISLTITTFPDGCISIPQPGFCSWFVPIWSWNWWRQTNQICKNNKRKTDCKEIHFEKRRMKGKKHPPIIISLGTIIPIFIIIAHLRWTSSETSKYAIGITAGLFQKHFILEHPNKIKPVLGFATLFHPSIFLFNPSCEGSNTNKLLHFIAVSCV